MEEKVFDLDASLRRLDGNRELYQDLVQFFLEDSPGLLDQLRRGRERQDLAILDQAAHNLKNLAGNFTARRAMDAARDLEQAIGQDDSAKALEAAARLEQEVFRLRQAIEPMRPRKPR